MHRIQDQPSPRGQSATAGGFTLIEILVALLLLCMAAGVMATVYQRHRIQVQQRVVQKDLSAGLADLGARIAKSLDATGKKTVAVVQFSDLDGRTSQFGQFVGEELTTQLFRQKAITVIERRLIERLVEEHKLSFSGLLDSTTIKEFGKISGADAICSGTVADLGTSVRINARLIDVQNGAVFAAAAVQLHKDDRVRRLMEKTLPAKGA